MDNLYYTYAYLRENGTPYYIGKGKEKRAFERHRKQNIPLPPKERILFLKTGLTEEQAFRHEIYMIFVHGRKDQGTGILHNRTNGGEGLSGFRHTLKTVEKIRKAHQGKSKSANHREKLREAALNRKPPSEETREKMRQSQRGRSHSPEVREKIRRSNIGQIRSTETREKIRQSKQIISEETREKLRQAALRRERLKREARGK